MSSYRGAKRRAGNRNAIIAMATSTIASTIWMYKFLEIRELRVMPSERNETTIIANPTNNKEERKTRDSSEGVNLTVSYCIFLSW